MLVPWRVSLPFRRSLGSQISNPCVFFVEQTSWEKKTGGKNPDGKIRMVLQMYIEVPRPNEGWKLPTSKKKHEHTLPETKSLHLKINAWKTILSFLDLFHVLGGYVKFLGCI